MEQSKKLSSRIVMSAGAVALLGGFAVGYGVERHGETSASAAPQPAAATNHKAARYKVPVSVSQPKLGPDDAPVTIVQWCDLRGKPCRDVDAPMKQLMQKYGDQLRWVHRQLPDPARKDSMLIHHFARGAFQVGKFWEVRERLLRSPEGATLTKDDLHRMASELGIDWAAIDKGLNDRAFAGYVGVDIIFAGKFGVDSGPAFFVNGRRLATVPVSELEQALSKLIEEELAEATWHVQHGVAKADVYREITKDGLWAINDDPAKRQAQAKAAGGLKDR